MRRLVIPVVLLFAIVTGCGSSSPGVTSRSLARTVLIVVAAGATAAAVGSAIVSESKESDLRNDLASMQLTGRQFADRDAEGMRWNRAARASAFAAGLAVVGLGIVWEMGLGDPAASRDGAPPAPLQAPGAARGPSIETLAPPGLRGRTAVVPRADQSSASAK